MSYSREALKGLEDGFLGLEGKCNDLNSSYLMREFSNERAQEFARHGFCRRLGLMTRCIRKVFELLPPDTLGAPDADESQGATVHLQAFVFNTYGCLDNLAHIWVLERGVKQVDGTSLHVSQVGLGRKNKEVLGSLPKEFTDYLSELSEWFDYLEGFRHALAHRIPLYIPSGVVPDEKAEEYADIQARINEAMRRHDFEMVDRLEEEQRDLLAFPVIATHSFGENADILYFHAQMLSDFNTVREIATRMLSCLDR